MNKALHPLRRAAVCGSFLAGLGRDQQGGLDLPSGLYLPMFGGLYPDDLNRPVVLNAQRDRRLNSGQKQKSDEKVVQKPSFATMLRSDRQRPQV